MIVAVSMDTFDNYPGAGANPNLNPICNQGIQIICMFLRLPGVARTLTRCRQRGHQARDDHGPLRRLPGREHRHDADALPVIRVA
jgi:hypothetical protein